MKFKLHKMPKESENSYESNHKFLFSLLQASDSKLHLNRKDIFFMLSISFLYSIIAFTHLGSLKAPQTMWEAESENEQVIFDLNEPVDFNLLYFTGMNGISFTVSVSNDGKQWSEDFLLGNPDYYCFRWYYTLQTEKDGRFTRSLPEAFSNIRLFHGRYLRLSASADKASLFEIAARTPDGRDLPLKIISQTSPSHCASSLIDERNCCPVVPGWYNGTYFDEIYYARSAYEYLHRQPVFEWTHPPLGKLFMAASISFFGMTPFGWRFPGALTGVLMLPVIYLLAMQLTHNRTAAVLSITSLALDLMHLTQTRIATIDSFPVFFIMLSFLFMIRYIQTDPLHVSSGHRVSLFDDSFRKALSSLFMSGLFFSLACACKWIGIYAGAGLAVLFFFSLYKQHRYAKTAGTFSESAENTLTDLEKLRVKIAKSFLKKRLLITCLFCILFFIILPLAIYALSYLPMFLSQGNLTFSSFLQNLWNEQKKMLAYHATPGLGAGHPYSSCWWQWPFNMKPILYAWDCFTPDGFSSSITCAGNPWIFATGILCIILTLLSLFYKRIKLRENVTTVSGDTNLSLFVISVGFLSQYLPWVFVPRGTFIYHYFASVPFLILASSFILSQLKNKSRRIFLITLHLMISLLFFILLFPGASGAMISSGRAVNIF